MANTNLANAKTAKNDEFYTQYPDIQKEINVYLDYDPTRWLSREAIRKNTNPQKAIVI